MHKNTLKNDNTAQGHLVKDITNSAILNNLDQNKANSQPDISTNQFNHYTADEFEIEYMPADIGTHNNNSIYLLVTNVFS